MTKRGLNQYYEVISAYFVLKAVHVTTQQQQENISVFAARFVTTWAKRQQKPKLSNTRNKNRLPGLIMLAPLQKTRYTMSKNL